MEIISYLKKLMKYTRTNEAKIDSHIGRRGNNGVIHPVATFETDGFLSHLDKRDIDFKCNYAKTVEQKSDGSNISVLELGIGLWIGRNFSDRPVGVDDSFCLVEVKGASQGKIKQITFYWLTAYKKYVRSVYKSIDSNWFNNEWESIQLLNEHVGFAYIRRERVNSLTLVEINFSVTHPENIGSRPIFKLPVGYSNTSSRPQNVTAIGQLIDTNENKPITCVINSNSEIIAYRSPTDVITKVAGTTLFLR